MPAYYNPPLAALADAVTLRQQFMHKIERWPQRYPDEARALDAVNEIFGGIVYSAAAKPLETQILAAIEAEVQMHELLEGERPADPAQAVAWDEAIGVRMEAMYSGSIRELGQGWIGEHVDGPHWHEKEGRAKVAKSAAEGLARIYATSSTPEAIGLHQADFPALAKTLLGKTPSAAKPSTPASAEGGDANTAVQLLARHLQEGGGAGRPDKDLISDIEFAADDDEILSPGSLQRLGLAIEHKPHIIAYRDSVKRNKAKWAERLLGEARKVEKFDDQTPSAAATEALAPAAEKPVRRRLGRKPKGDNHPQALEALKALAKWSDLSERDLAGHLGLSRNKVNAHIEGKAVFAPTDDQLNTLTQILSERATALTNAATQLAVARLA